MSQSEKPTDALPVNNSSVSLHQIRPLHSSESKYIKPMRMKFTINGRTREWDCLKAHDSVASVIYNKTRNKLIYVKQFRPAVYLASLTNGMRSLDNVSPEDLGEVKNLNVGFTMELCAGISDKEGLTPQQIMQEEIFEETGYKVPINSVKFISSFRGSTGLSGTLMNLYFTEVIDSQKVNQGGGVDDESIEVLEVDPEDARKYMFCQEEEAPFSRPPAMIVGTLWFLNQYQSKTM